MKKKWLKILIECDRQLVDAVTDFLVGILGAGVEGGVEDRVGSTVVNGYIEFQGQGAEWDDRLDQLKEHLVLLADIFGVAVPSLEFEVIDNQDWSTSWQKFFKPFAIVPSLIIAPTWENYQVKAGEKLIEIDPGMAFGTGHHPTTTMTVQFIQRVLAAEKENAVSVLDVGTGTGILGMAALLFGAERVLGIDNDPEAIAVAGRNIKENGLEGAMSLSTMSLKEIAAPFLLVTANIIHDVLLELADDLCRLTASGGHLVLSGILSGDQARSMISSMEERGMVLVDIETMEEWSALLFRNK